MDHQDFEKMFRKMCKFDHTLGLEFRVDAPGKIEYWMTVDENHQSSPQTIHGGVIAAMMDAQLGMTALSYAVTKGKLCSTVELKTNFTNAPNHGDELYGQGEIDFVGNSLMVCSATIKRRRDHIMIAKGMGTFNLYPMEKRKELEQWMS